MIVRLALAGLLAASGMVAGSSVAQGPMSDQPTEIETDSDSESVNYTPADSIHECSTLAAHPHDPERETDGGVVDEDLSSEIVIKVCSDALTEFPDDPVYRFQLARGYWKEEQYAIAIEELVLAAEEDHGGALAYLGDAVLYGLGGLEQNPELAKQLYSRAAEEGFEPALAVAQQIKADSPGNNEDPRGGRIIGNTAEMEEIDDADYRGPSHRTESNAGSEYASSGKLPELESIMSPRNNSDKAPGDASQYEYRYPIILKALTSGNLQPEGMQRGSLLVYALASLVSVVERCPELRPPGFDAQEGFLRAMNVKLNSDEKVALTKSYEKGEMAEIQDGAAHDGARLTDTFGCTATQTKSLVETVVRYYISG
jgi:TPR repeat protein